MTMLARSHKIWFATLGLLALADPALLPLARGQSAPSSAQAFGNNQVWLTYKGDLQRTASRNNPLTLPLNLIWRHSTLAAPKEYFGSPLVVGPPGQRRIYFPAGRNIVCIDSQTGALLWRSTDFTSTITAPISLLSGEGGDLILVVTTGGRLVALRTADGGQAWEADAQAAVFGTGPTFVNTPSGERILVGNARGSLVAFTREGTLDATWKVTLGRSTPNATPAISVDGTRLFITTSDRKLFAVDLQKGAVAYGIQLKGSTSAPPAVLDDRLIVANGTLVTALRESTGETIWKTDTTEQIVASPAVRVDENGNRVIYIGTSRGNFYAIDAERGRVLWKTSLKASVTGTAVVLKGLLLVGASNGVFYGLNTEKGTVRWQYRLHSERMVTTKVTTRTRGAGAEGATPAAATSETRTVMRPLGVSSAPSVVGTQVYLLADNAALYSFDMTPFDADPPLAVQPSLSVPTTTVGLHSYLLNPDTPQLVPPKGPIYFAVELNDEGSGVDPDSLKVSLNGQEIKTTFNAGKGIATALLAARDKTKLPDGLKNLTLTVRDYRGNALTYTTSFMVDSNVASPAGRPPKPRVKNQQGTDGGR
ncbi:MAG TPA: PQQ-binding-like beta-propeller repeat protein [Abditibacteriaceae bacterium]|nr:PQQ-binding-like beta-propeller repeat protein [Abditibacteriaceae bacterium]